LPTIRKKLLLGLAALVLAVISIVGLLTERGLRARTLEGIEGSLAERAELVSEWVGTVAFLPENAARLDAIADRAGRAANARITLIAADGRVVGDSDVALEALASVEIHAERPEVMAALSGRVGRSSRLSRTVGRNLLYLAVPAGQGSEGVIRLAVDLVEIDAAVRSNRNALLLAAGAGLAAAFILSLMLARITIRPIEELRDVVVAIADGELDQRMRLLARDDLGEIGLAIHSVAEQLRSRLDEATREKEQLTAVLGSMVEGVMVLDAEGRIALANPRLRELLDLWGPLENRPWFEVIRQPDSAAAVEEALASRELITREVEGGSSVERILQLNAVGFPAEGPRAGTVLVLHDVTEMRQLDSVRRDFIANASHELRTPLAAIQGFAETLSGGEIGDSDRERYTQTILRNAHRMSSLVEDLLALSRTESGSHQLEITRVDVADTIRVLLGDQAPRLEAASILASVDVRGPAFARADQQAVEQVLTNLLDNAVKYTPAEGRIELTVEEAGPLLRVDVRDTGIGIPPEDRARIFERFYRVDAARSRALGGTGLGLAIVKHLVQSMGGEISVESEAGSGSCFSFTLPRDTTG